MSFFENCALTDFYIPYFTKVFALLPLGSADGSDTPFFIDILTPISSRSVGPFLANATFDDDYLDVIITSADQSGRAV
jgi:hypothetical protein